MSGTDEDASEVEARVAIEGALGVRLDRVAPRSEGATHDYDLVMQDVRIAIEVKRATSREFRHITSAAGDVEFFNSSRLSNYWWVVVEAPTLGDKLPSMPEIPDVGPEDGNIQSPLTTLRFVPKAERIEQERRRALHRAQWKPPSLKHLGRDIENDLVLLESQGVTTTRGLEGDLDCQRAIIRIEARTNHGHAMSSTPTGNQSPGVEIVVGSGYVRTGQPDTLAVRLQLWLDSSMSANLRTSLANAVADERHGVLVFDPSTEPEFESVREWTELPSISLQLGDHVDTLWCILGPTTLQYSDSRWQRFDQQVAD